MGVIYLGSRIDALEKVVESVSATTNANAADIDALETAVARTFVSTGTEITNVNTFLTPGIYSRLSGVSDVANRPANNAFILEVITMTTNGYFTLQRWTDCTTGKIYTRVYRQSTTTWTDWAELAVVTT